VDRSAFPRNWDGPLSLGHETTVNGGYEQAQTHGTHILHSSFAISTSAGDDQNSMSTPENRVKGDPIAIVVCVDLRGRPLAGAKCHTLLIPIRP
jgi:hypothetical protein